MSILIKIITSLTVMFQYVISIKYLTQNAPNQSLPNIIHRCFVHLSEVGGVKTVIAEFVEDDFVGGVVMGRSCVLGDGFNGEE